MAVSRVGAAAGVKHRIAGLLFGMLAVLVFQPDARAGMSVESARIRLPLPGQTTAVVYFDLHNGSGRDLKLVAVAVQGAQRAEIHQHLHVDGMMQMRAVPEIMVAAGQSVVFQPHGYHVMAFAMAPQPAPAPDDSVTVTLTFGDGSTLETLARVFRY